MAGEIANSVYLVKDRANSCTLFVHIFCSSLGRSFLFIHKDYLKYSGKLSSAFWGFDKVYEFVFAFCHSAVPTAWVSYVPVISALVAQPKNHLQRICVKSVLGVNDECKRPMDLNI